MIYLDANVVNKKEQIQQFRANKYGIQFDGKVSSDQNELREDLTNAVEQLSTGLYEKNVHFLMELIQNAEDNAYPQGTQPQLKLVLLNEDPTNTSGSDGCLCVFNNETGFSQENIKGISGVGKSTKKNKAGYIGEKGIGFKSVFIVTSSPHIFSNGYQIRFLEKDEEFDLNYIVPYWVDQAPALVREQSMTTSLLLPLKPGKKAEIIEYLKGINPETLLFLNKLRSLNIEIPGEDTIRVEVTRSADDVLSLSTKREGETSTNHYWLYSESVKVPQHLKQGEQKEEKREGIHYADITLALPLEHSEAEGRVFAYLPTEVDSGLPFLINSDFLLTANRESFQADRPWNQWLKDKIPSVVLNALEKMRLQEAYRKTFYRYIPLEATLRTLSDFFAPIVEEVVTELSKKPIVLSASSDLLLASDTRFPDKKTRALFSPETLPSWFENIGFVDPELTPFEKQIKAIGSKSLGKTEFTLILGDKDWLDVQSDSWLISLWKYLRESNYKKDMLADKYLLPTHHGVRMRAKDHVFFAHNAELVASLPEESRGLVNFLQKGFVEKELSSYLREEELVHQFSLDHFIGGAWLEDVTKRVTESFSIDWFLEANKFLCSVLPKLNEQTHRFIKARFHILNEENKPVSLVSNGSKQILFPRGFDSEMGWQLFFDPVEDHGNCEVLSNQYLNFKDIDKLELESFLEMLGATRVPVTAKKIVTKNDAWHYDYCRFAFDGFSSHYTGGTIPALYYYPNISDFNKVINNEVSRRAYLNWLNEGGSKLASKPYIEYQYQHKRKHWVDESALIYSAKRVSLIKTQHGLKKPSEVFEDKQSTREVLGDTVPYLQDEISEEIRQQLGIRKEANSDELIQYLKDASSSSSVAESKVLLRVYEYLGKAGFDTQELKKLFADEALIYIPDQGWLKSGQTVWENAEAVFGTTKGWLSQHYPDSLKDFFLSQVSVKEQVDDDSYIDAWLTYQKLSTKSVDPEEVECFLIQAMPRIINMIRKEPERESLIKFQQDAKLWIRAKSWQSPMCLYASDNRKLADIFKDLPYVWRLPNRSYEYMSPIFNLLSIPKLSEKALYKVKDATNSKVRANQLLTRHCMVLLAYFLNSHDKDDQGLLKARIDDGLFESLYQVKECVVGSLVIDVSVDLYRATITDHICHLDFENHTLYVDGAADSDDLKEELAAILKRVLFGGRQGEFEDTILRLLAVDSPKREASIRDKKDWHLSKDLRSQLIDVDKAQLAKVQEQQKPDVPRKAERLSAENIGVESEATEESQKAKTSAKQDFHIVPTSPERQIQTSTNQSAPPKTPVSSSVVSSKAPLRYPTPSSGSGSFNSSARVHKTSSGNNSSAYRGESSGRSSTYAKTGKSRSNPANNIRTGRLRSYVSREKRDGDQPTSERNAFNKSLGDAAENIVKTDLTNKGYDVKEMPTNNRGYDFEVLNPHTGELFYVEVKGSYTAWSDKGVAISKPQYLFAERYQDNFILAVVDNLGTMPNSPLYLKNPTGNITEYRFDRGWADAAIDLTLDSSVPQQLLITDPIAERVELTDSEVCKALLLYCHEQNYPIPEVGVELQNEDEEVIFDALELCWQEERVAIVLSQDDLEQVRASIQGWSFWLGEALNSLKEHLDEIFG